MNNQSFNSNSGFDLGKIQDILISGNKTLSDKLLIMKLNSEDGKYYLLPTEIQNAHGNTSVKVVLGQDNTNYNENFIFLNSSAEVNDKILFSIGIDISDKTQGMISVKGQLFAKHTNTLDEYEQFIFSTGRTVVYKNRPSDATSQSNVVGGKGEGRIIINFDRCWRQQHDFWDAWWNVEKYGERNDWNTPKRCFGLNPLAKFCSDDVRDLEADWKACRDRWATRGSPYDDQKGLIAQMDDCSKLKANCSAFMEIYRQECLGKNPLPEADCRSFMKDVEKVCNEYFRCMEPTDTTCKPCFESQKLTSESVVTLKRHIYDKFVYLFDSEKLIYVSNYQFRDPKLMLEATKQYLIPSFSTATFKDSSIMYNSLLPYFEIDESTDGLYIINIKCNPLMGDGTKKIEWFGNFELTVTA